jgi:hypothetical protein|tara:strand:- start:758 stop:979 length:222 start_codon:yes stop_codon:yes gene_type:complete
MKLLLNRQVRVNVASKAKLANKARVANMVKVATQSRKPANSRFIHLSAIKAYKRQQAWKLKVREMSKIQFALA